MTRTFDDSWFQPSKLPWRLSTAGADTRSDPCDRCPPRRLSKLGCNTFLPLRPDKYSLGGRSVPGWLLACRQAPWLRYCPRRRPSFDAIFSSSAVRGRRRKRHLDFREPSCAALPCPRCRDSSRLQDSVKRDPPSLGQGLVCRHLTGGFGHGGIHVPRCSLSNHAGIPSALTLKTEGSTIIQSQGEIGGKS
jgi:hypothetical protein